MAIWSSDRWFRYGVLSYLYQPGLRERESAIMSLLSIAHCKAPSASFFNSNGDRPMKPFPVVCRMSPSSSHLPRCSPSSSSSPGVKPNISRKTAPLAASLAVLLWSSPGNCTDHLYNFLMYCINVCEALSWGDCSVVIQAKYASQHWGICEFLQFTGLKFHEKNKMTMIFGLVSWGSWNAAIELSILGGTKLEFWVVTYSPGVPSEVATRVALGRLSPFFWSL